VGRAKDFLTHALGCTSHEDLVEMLAMLFMLTASEGAQQGLTEAIDATSRTRNAERKA
jgi:hypothetical protein